ncbi:MAG: PAS domain S-box protein, partial [Sedimentisphaerales bacterium]|nr:PAS domain S-box protein [Sedimentisphaerales bacterium]
QLMAANQQLLASEQQLRAANQQLSASNQQLQASEDQLKIESQTTLDIVRSIPAGLFVYQYDSNSDKLILLDANPEAQRLTGLDIETWRGREFDEVWPQAREMGITEAFLSVPRTGKPYQRENLYYKDKLLDYAYRVSVFCMPRNRVGVAFEDITARKNAKISLQESETRYRTMFAHMNEAVAVYRAVNDGEDFIFVDFNQAGERIENIKADELIGRSVQEVFPGVREFGILDAFQRVYKTGNPEHFPLGFYEDDRITGWRENYIYKLPSGEVVAVYSDETQRKKTEESLVNSEHRYRTLFETMTQGVVYQDREGRIISANPSAQRILGLSLDEMTGRTSHDPRWHAIREDGSEFPGDDHPIMVALRSGQPVQNVIMGIFNPMDNEYRWININATPQFKSGENTPYQVYASFSDITERKRARDALAWELTVNETLSELYQPLTSPLATLEGVATCVLECAQKLTDSHHGYVSSVDPVTGNCISHTLTSMFGSACQMSDQSQNIIFPKGENGLYPALWGHSLNTREAFYTNNPESHPSFKAVPEGHIPVERFLAVPVIYDQELVGQIALANKRSDYTDRDLEAIERLGEYYALAIQRQRTQEALRSAKDDWENIFESISDTALILDRDHCIIDSNHAAITALHKSKEEVIGQKCYELFHCTDHTPEECPHKKLLESAQPETVEMEMDALDGIFLVSVSPIFDSTGKVVKTIHIAKDITQRKQVEERLRLLSSAVQQTNDGVAMADLKGNIMFVNKAFAQSHGYTPDECMGKHLSLFHTPDQISAVEEANRQVIESGQFYGEIWHTHRDGFVFPTIMNNTLLKDEQDRPVGLIGTLHDISDLKQAEQALRDSETRLQSIFRVAPTGIGVISNRVLKQVNERVCEITGYTREELLEQNARMLYPSQEDYDYVGREKYRQIREHGTGTVESRWQRKDGKIIDVLLSSTPMEPDDYSIGFTFTVLDITDRKQAEREIQNLAKYPSQDPNPVLRASKEGVLLQANQASDKLLKVWNCQVGNELPEYWKNLIQETWSGGDNKYAEILCEDQFFTVTIAPVKEEDYVNLYAGDITDRKRIEQEREALIAQLETQNAELERFTYTVSHDLKSPLITIKGFLGMLEEDMVEHNEQQAREDMKRISSAATKMHQLLDELLELSRIGRMINPSVKISLRTLVDEALEITAGRIKQKNIQVEIVSELPMVYGDHRRLLEVIQNLIDNAANFIPPDEPQPRIEIGVRQENGESIYFVRDNGIGIAPHYHNKIFGLFDKLDPNSDGTGIGLALVKRIIELHKGRIWVESDGIGHGSTFCFTLPLMPGEEALCQKTS